MAITNLTNTKWCLKGDGELILNNDFSYDINFTSKNTNFTQFIFSQSSYGLFYNNTQVYEKGYYEDWLDWDYRFITIAGGNDTQNSTLIQWLEANAVLVPNDLTNTKWNLGNNITFEIASYDFKGTYAINFKTGGNVNYTSLSLVYEINTNKVKYDSTSVWEDDETPWMSDSSNSQITITGGTDVANSNLIKWLCLNGTYVNLITYDLTQLQLSAGAHTVQVRARAQNYRDSNFSNSVSYVVAQPSGGTVVFSFEDSQTGSKDYIKIYDGQDDTGTLLFESEGQVATPSPTLTCTTGYLFVGIHGAVASIKNITLSENITLVVDSLPPEDFDGDDWIVLKVDGNGTVSAVLDWSD